MNIEANSGNVRKMRNVHEHCEMLKLRATLPAEPKWMAELFRVIADGGVLAIRPAGREEVVVEFTGIHGGVK